eukprot:Sspe_Gene.47602::Locus_24368_Transcript_1_1_Confidence_1.000_Length_2533::g.47602::m.47602
MKVFLCFAAYGRRADGSLKVSLPRGWHDFTREVLSAAEDILGLPNCPLSDLRMAYYDSSGEKCSITRGTFETFLEDIEERQSVGGGQTKADNKVHITYCGTQLKESALPHLVFRKGRDRRRPTRRIPQMERTELVGVDYHGNGVGMAHQGVPRELEVDGYISESEEVAPSIPVPNPHVNGYTHSSSSTTVGYSASSSTPPKAGSTRPPIAKPSEAAHRIRAVDHTHHPAPPYPYHSPYSTSPLSPPHPAPHPPSSPPHPLHTSPPHPQLHAPPPISPQQHLFNTHPASAPPLEDKYDWLNLHYRYNPAVSAAMERHQLETKAANLLSEHERESLCIAKDEKKLRLRLRLTLQQVEWALAFENSERLERDSIAADQTAHRQRILLQCTQARPPSAAGFTKDITPRPPPGSARPVARRMTAAERRIIAPHSAPPTRRLAGMHVGLPPLPPFLITGWRAAELTANPSALKKFKELMGENEAEHRLHIEQSEAVERDRLRDLYAQSTAIAFCLNFLWTQEFIERGRLAQDEATEAMDIEAYKSRLWVKATLASNRRELEKEEKMASRAASSDSPSKKSSLASPKDKAGRSSPVKVTLATPPADVEIAGWPEGPQGTGEPEVPIRPMLQAVMPFLLWPFLHHLQPLSEEEQASENTERDG